MQLNAPRGCTLTSAPLLDVAVKNPAAIQKILAKIQQLNVPQNWSIWPAKRSNGRSRRAELIPHTPRARNPLNREKQALFPGGSAPGPPVYPLPFFLPLFFFPFFLNLLLCHFSNIHCHPHCPPTFLPFQLGGLNFGRIFCMSNIYLNRDP